MSRGIIHATWDDVPHLSDEQKKRMWDDLPAWKRKIAARGIPILGSGAIYPIAEEDITVSDFEIPVYWPRVYSMDVGWNKTAGLWGAINRDNDVLYCYSEYYQGEEKPVVHAAGFKARGDWIPGVIDPAARGRSQLDGGKLIDEYYKLGLKLSTADNAVEAGLFAVYGRMSSGRFKVFKSCVNFFEEYRMYRRDKNGKIVKERDHLMDCARYLTMSGISIARVMPIELVDPNRVWRSPKKSAYDPLQDGWN